MGDRSTHQPPEAAADRTDRGNAPGSKHALPTGVAGVPAELSDADLMSLPAERFARGRPTTLRAVEAEREPGEEPDPLLGTTLHDTYAVSRILGEGGMGRVYEAHHTRIRSKRYAIKILHPEFSLNPEIRLRFQREAEAAAAVEHDGVVGTYDLGKTPQGWPYMVCEYLAGVDLNDYLKSHGAMPARTVVHIGKQLCSALGAAHARGVIHRDLKPHNVFVLQSRDSATRLKEDGETGAEERQQLPSVKVLDFGLSRFEETDNELTKTGTILGTPGYMAPEQANGLATDLRTDVYGIGALLYAAATGRAPFKEETPQQTVLAVMSQEPPRPRELAPALPVELEIVIQKAMARDPAQRYQNAGEMERALAALYRTSSPLNRRGQTSGGGPPPVPRLSLVLYVTAGLLLGGISLAGALLALLEIKGISYANFHPSLLERLLFLLLAAFGVLSLALFIRRVRRRLWHNSARVAELIPKLRAPLTAALLAYGISALLVRSGAILSGVASGSLSHSSLTSAHVLYVVLPLNALLAASAIALRNAFLEANNAFVRALTGVGYSAGAFMAALLLLGLSFVWQPREGGPQVVSAVGGDSTVAPLAKTSGALMLQQAEPQSSARGAAAPSEATTAADAPVGASAAPPNDDGDDAPRPPEAATASPEEASHAAPPAVQTTAAQLAPKAELAIATEDGAEALEKLSQSYPQDSRLLKALVLARASRADTLDLSMKAIARLLEIDPTFATDPDVLFILKKGLQLKGNVFAAATSTVKRQMGRDGAELLYQVMSEHPEQRSRLRFIFQELRQANQASREVLIAYDLRYATSCRARLPLIERAEKFGDTRSLHQLQALSTAPKRCGWGRTCYPPCRAEAEQFAESAKVISQRLSEVKP